MDSAITSIVQMGILGPIVVALGYAVFRLQRQLTTVQNERVEDAQKVVDRLLALQKSIDDNTAAIHEMRKDMRSGLR